MVDRPSPPAEAARVGAEQLAALSHEFRTPLNGVLGMARLLEGTALTEEQKSYVAALRESGEHLLGLVNDLLDFAKLGATRVELHPARFAAEDLLRGVCELLAPRAQEKGLEIAWAAPAHIGAIEADEGRLRQVLLNFAGNAIKFTKQGGVLVTVAEAGPDRLRFTVSDTGPGVPQADRARIFEAFAQSDPAHDGVQLGGAGLGLAIARTLALVMDGEVGVDEAPGGGAAFWMEARLAWRRRAAAPRLAGRTVGVLSANPAVAEAARLQVEALGGKALVARDAAAIPQAEVLLVEDNAINALLARTLLTREGCQVDQAAGGQEALAALAIGAYDLILMDMRMPGMSGLEATRRIRGLGIDTPVVALTANVFEEDRHACLEAGMEDFLVKPLGADALRRVLAQLKRGGWTEAAARAKLA